MSTITKYQAEETPAYRLCHDAIDVVVERFKMREIRAADGGPYHSVLSTDGSKEVGEYRVWIGEGGVFKMIYAGLVANPPGVDSHMMFCFTPDNSPVPHFTVDSVHLAHMGHYSFHCEIMPRVDYGMNLPYLDHVYTPLSEANHTVYHTPGIAKTEALSLRQWALMSPWMLAGRAANLEAFQTLDQQVAIYRDHWIKLVEAGIPEDCLEGVTEAGLIERDRRNRGYAFHRDVDPVYNQLKPLIGEQQGDMLIQLLCCQDGILESGDHR